MIPDEAVELDPELIARAIITDLSEWANRVEKSAK